MIFSLIHFVIVFFDHISRNMHYSLLQVAVLLTRNYPIERAPKEAFLGYIFQMFSWVQFVLLSEVWASYGVGGPRICFTVLMAF